MANPIHAKLLTPRCFAVEIEGDDEWRTDGLKRWTPSPLRVVEEVALPDLSQEERVAWVICLAPHASTRTWAVEWLSGRDRSEAAAAARAAAAAAAEARLLPVLVRARAILAGEFPAERFDAPIEEAVDCVTRNRFEASIAAGVTGQLLGEHSTRLLLSAPGEASEIGEHLAADMARLPERVRRVLAARFGEDLTLDDVGEREHVQRERIRQIEAKGLRLMLREHACRTRRVEAVRESRGLAKEGA